VIQNMRRRLVLGGGAAVAASLLFGGRARAGGGTRIALVVASAPGSAADTRARSFAPFLERHLPGTRLVVDNQPGAAGLAALRVVAEAAPGSALAWIATPSLPARSVDCDGFAAAARQIVLVGAVQQEKVVFATADDATTSLEQIVQRTAEAGAAQVLGTSAPGSPAHLAALQLQASAGVRLNIVAFPSAAAAREAVLAGALAVAALPFGQASDALQDGRLHAVELPAGGRVAGRGLAGKPELGLAMLIHRGLGVHARTEAASLARLREALAMVVADPEFLDQAAADGFVASFLDGPAWTARAAGEQIGLARLWLATPWLGAGIG
jgi:tripartite-type tricarboxylate transporter receptor subunit TctC